MILYIQNSILQELISGAGASTCSQPSNGLLMITTAHHKISAVLLCRLDLYLTNQHQAMASSSNSKHCSPPAQMTTILEGTSRGQEHARMCTTLYRPVGSLRLHPWGLL
uniref:Uncharacterized protein n=1 Tax=Zea mays TaxID=4577 RepID=C0PLB6_MAIZE|nr:unknown [Zea mays]ACR35671.1 unknown [Zea mays]